MPVELRERVDVAGLAPGNQIGGIPVGPVHRQLVRRDGRRRALLHGTTRRFSAGRGSAFPAQPVEVEHPSPRDRNPFCHKKSALEALSAAVFPDAATGGDDAVAGNIRPVAAPHDVPNRPPGTRCARQRGDISVRRHAARRDPPDRREHARREIRAGFQLRSTSCWPYGM